MNADSVVAFLKEKGNGFIEELYSKSSHQQIENTILHQLKGFLGEKSEELKKQVYENYKEFLLITKSLEEIEQDFMTIRTQFNSIGTELDELNQHYVSEMKEQQQKLDKLIKEREKFLNIKSGKTNEEDEMEKKIKELREQIRIILDAPSLLQVYLSQWNFEECIKIHQQVNNLLNENSDLKNALKGHVALDEFYRMIDDIIEKLQKRLDDLSLSQKQTNKIIGYLQQLTNVDKAMLIFLDARSKTAKEKIDKELLSNNISLVTQNICMFAFRLIKTTHSIFTTSFPSAPSSCFTSWNVTITNYVMETLENKITSNDNKQNSIKVDCIDKILTAYEIIPQELSLIFIVRKYLSNIAVTLSTIHDEIDSKMIQKLRDNGLTLPF